ncbi:MAG: hypothetical protein NC086_07050, partial [Alistipes sp.]|nr:hypothetical protein [Alistipes sp.]
MGFFDDLKKEISQAVTELVSDEELLKEEDVYDAGIEDMTSKTAGTDDTDYLDEDDYIETEEDYAEDIQPSKVVVDDLASDEYVNTMNIDIKDLIASYSNELSGNVEAQDSQDDYEETYNGSYQNSYDNPYDRTFDRSYNGGYAVTEPDNEMYIDNLSGNDEASETMEAMDTLGFANDLAQMYGDDDDV